MEKFGPNWFAIKGQKPIASVMGLSHLPLMRLGRIIDKTFERLFYFEVTIGKVGVSKRICVGISRDELRTLQHSTFAPGTRAKSWGLHGERGLLYVKGITLTLYMIFHCCSKTIINERKVKVRIFSSICQWSDHWLRSDY